MARRAALVTQADIERAIRAVKKATGLAGVRVVMRPDGVIVEAADGSAPVNTVNPKKIVL